MIEGLIKELDNIFILGKGPTLDDSPIRKPLNSEFWGCNDIYKMRGVDRLFIMHDIYLIQKRHDKNLIKDINKEDFPVYTLGSYCDIKNSVLYPIQEVMDEFDTDFLVNTASYMLALAIMQRPKKVVLYGVDMYYGTSSEYMRIEKGCLEFWLGVATGREIRYAIAEGSTLMKRRGSNLFYGMNVRVNPPYNTITVRPKYDWGLGAKSAIRYKLVKTSHKL